MRLQQTLHGVPVRGGDVNVTLTEAGVVRFVAGSPRHDADAPADREWVRAPAEASWIAAANTVLHGPLREPLTVERIYDETSDGELVAAWAVTLPSREPLATWYVVVADETGSVISSEDILMRDHPTATGRVFDPSPVVTAGGNVIPGNPANVTDCDSPTPAEATLFSAQYRDKQLLGIDPGQGRLTGEYVDIVGGTADESSHQYSYTCDDPRFEEVMAYHHIDAAQRVIQSLGFVGASAIHDFPVAVHPHVAGCSSFYSGAIFLADGAVCSGRPLFVDHGEDADIIVHEYGHALQSDLFQHSGPIGVALSEGFADFFAASMLNDPCMYEWASALGYPDLVCSRNLDTGQFFDNYVTGEMRFHRYYPEDLYGDGHGQGLVMFGALWDAGDALGGDEAARHKMLKLALQAHFTLASTAGVPEFASAVRQADLDLYGGADLPVLDAAFRQHNICWTPGACISGMYRVQYITGASTNFNSCTAYAEQIGNGAGPNGIEGHLSCTTARNGTFTSAHINQVPNPKTVETTMQFTVPNFSASSLGTTTTGAAVSGDWDCVPTCPGTSGTYLANRVRRTSSAFIRVSDGGTLQTQLGDQLTVSANSIPNNATFVIEIEPVRNVPPGVRVISRAFRISPSGMTFSPPAQMVFRYVPDDIAGLLDPNQLRVMIWDEGQWRLVGGEVNTSTMTVTVQLDHLSEYALFDCLTGLTDTDADQTGDACDPDDDGDSCNDAQELANQSVPKEPNDPLDGRDFPDADLNGSVSFGDFILLLAAWSANANSTNWDARVDFDKNGTIGFGDFVSVLAAWNRTCS